MLGHVASSHQANPDGRDGRSPYRPGQVLVAAADADVVVAALGGAGVACRRADVPGVPVVCLELEPSDGRPSAPELVRLVRARVPGARVAVNAVLRAASHVQMAGATQVRPAGALGDLPTAETLPGSGVTVGVVDSGFCADPWFGSRVEARGQDLEAPPDSTDEPLQIATGHGTFVAGVILQHAPGARVVARRVIDDKGEVDDKTLASALDGLERVDILNLSLGGTVDDNDDANDLLATASGLMSLWERNPDLVVVAPAGNNHADERFWPARFDRVVSVAALDAAGDALAEFSNFGDWVNCCARGSGVHSRFLIWDGDVLAPPDGHHGKPKRVPSDPFEGWATWDGTSFAAARVTGAIAAAMSRNGGDGPAAVREVLGGPSGPSGGGTLVDPESFVEPVER